MNKRQREKIEKLLLKERERLLEHLAEFDERFAEIDQDGEISHYPLHMADEGTETMEQEKEFLLASQDGRQLYAVDEALRKLYKRPEEFGKCERCGGEIGFERLEIVPAARYCVACKRHMEENGEGADENEAA